MPRGYWIVRVDVRNEEPVKRYVAGNHPIFEKFGGRYLVRAQKFEVPEGSSRSLHVVIEFPDYAAALACYHSREYQTNKKIREGHLVADSSLSKAMTASSHGAQRLLNDFPNFS